MVDGRFDDLQTVKQSSAVALTDSVAKVGSSVNTIGASVEESEAELSVVVVVVVELVSSHAAKTPSAMHAHKARAQILVFLINISPQFQI